MQRKRWRARFPARSEIIAALLLLLFACGCANRAATASGAPTMPPVSQSVTPSAASGGIVDMPLATTGCGKEPPFGAGRTEEMTLLSGGLQRMFRLHLPAGYNPSRPTPLVLNLPGHGESALQQERYSQYSALADQQNFIVVYPQGVIGPDGKLGWASYGKNDPTVNDVLFFSDLLTLLQQRLCVDARRIYATGISNGGGMTNLLACQMARRIAAFASVAAAIYPLPEGCHPTRAVSYLEFHGTADPLVPYNGSVMLHFMPVMDMLQAWATRDGCTGGPTVFFQ